MKNLIQLALFVIFIVNASFSYAITIYETDRIVYKPGPVEGIDAYVSPSEPNTPLGDLHFMIPGSLTAGWGLIKFDLTNISLYESRNIERMYFSLCKWDEFGSNIGVFKPASVWDENVTWNTRPSVVGDAVTITFASGHIDSWQDFEITDLAQEWLDDPASNYGMILYRVGSGCAIYFDTSDSSGWFHPEFIIEYEPSAVPEPTSIILLSLAIIGLIKRRIR